MTTKHSPTPWTVSRTTKGRAAVAYNAGSAFSSPVNVAECIGGHADSRVEAEANAAHIVACVNAHPALVAALEAIDAGCRVEGRATVFADGKGTIASYSIDAAVIDKMRAALAAAKGATDAG